MARYSAAGLANTAIGFGVIFALMAMGYNPYWSNIGGYFVGIVVAFFVNKTWVYKTQGRSTSHAMKFFVSIVIAYVCNLVMLKGLLQIDVWPYAAQIGAGVAYTCTMFILSTYWVFAGHAK